MQTSNDPGLEATIQHTIDAAAGSDAPQTRPSELTPGATVGRYTVLGKLGAGAMGVVYEAFDRDLDRRIAVKLLQRAESAELLGEAQAMAKLADPHVVAVYDVGTVRHADASQVFIAMEFVASGTLGRWLAASDREQTAILEVFAAAGQGLAAAHRAGLVHGDFKPENVLMTPEGVAKVTDFGLAHASGRVPTGASSSTTPLTASHAGRAQTARASDATANPLDATATPSEGTTRQRVRWCGTPAYMAPEQYRGNEASERSDQFSFCVALYEGLYGSRPFSGRSLVSLGVAICQNRRDPIPANVAVPRPILDVIDRGLATNPDDRFADMDALLAALRPPVVARGAGRTWVIASIGVLAGVGLAAGLLWSPEPPTPHPCAAATASVDEVWSDDARRRLRASIESTQTPDAAAVADHVGAELDTYAESMRAARTTACERRLGQQDTDRLHELRTACLDVREDALVGLLSALDTIDAAQVEHLGTATARLPAITACDDTERLLAELPLPAGDQVAAVDELRHELARVRTLIDSNSREASSAAEVAADRARATGYTPVMAEATYALGRARLADEQLDEAASEFEHAYFEALRVGHDEIAATAAAQLLFVIGVELGDLDAGLEWGNHGLAIAERGHHLRARAEVLGSLATLDRIAGKHELAVTHSREVVELLEAELGSEHLDTGRAYGNHGVALIGSGEPIPGLEWLERSAAIYRAKLGPTHHKLAAIWLNLAVARTQLNDPAQDALGLVELERADAILQAGKQSAKDLAFVRATRSEIYVRQRRLGDARSDRLFVVDAFRNYYGAEHPIVAEAELGLALSHLLANELEAGRPLAERADATLSGLAANSGQEDNSEPVTRAELIVAAFARAAGDPGADDRLARAWQAHTQAGGTGGEELLGWFTANPEFDPRA